MTDLAISINGLSKKYYIGAEQKNYDRFGEQVVDLFASPFRRTIKLLRGQVSSAAELEENIWALKDITLEIKHGEVVGVIGRNGAGKSTLLKILSRITEPTKGIVDIYGRVGSLLEVGTGFHPELTGRENIFLNGAILGMGKAEIDSKFDDIVAFAEIDKFIDTPVKHYSSGMYVRLAFSVAAHLEPEILLVDEVLAVGDLAFQKKCLGKIDNVAKQGRTVLFVSHNMAIIQNLCQRCILLQNGAVEADGPVSDTVNTYLKSLEQFKGQDLADRMDRKYKGDIRLTGIELTGGADGSSTILKTGEKAFFKFTVSNYITGIWFLFVIINTLGQEVAIFKSNILGPADKYDPEKDKTYLCIFDELLLMPGKYHLNVLVYGGGEKQDFVEAAGYFDVQPGLLDGRPMNAESRSVISATMPHRWILPVK